MSLSVLAARHEEAIDRTRRRFARASGNPATHYYVASKLRTDPAIRAIAALGPLDAVVDIGCGRGQLAVFLLEAGAAREVRGFDPDREKVALARRASEGLAAVFVDAGVGDGIASADTVLLVDVLHYMGAAQQEALLRSAARLVRPGGRLVVREATRGLGWRSVITLFVEWIARFVRLNVGERIAIRDVKGELVPTLEALDFQCTVTPCWEGTPFANVLLVATRGGRARLK